MKNCKKLFSGLLTIGFLATLVTGCGAKSAPMPGLAKNVLNRTAEQKTYSAADFEGEEAVDPKEISVNISQSTSTETSQLIDLKFRARTALGFPGSRNNYIAQIVDENFSGEPSKPVPDDKQTTYTRTYKYIDKDAGYDQVAEVPLFDGIISLVTGSKNTAADRKIYIPSFFVKKGFFAIAIKGIASNATTAIGEEYKHKNAWTDPKLVKPDPADETTWYYEPNPNKPKITDIYIPDTIETVEPGAFTSVPEDVTIHYEGKELPVGFAEDWTDAKSTQLDISENNYVDANNGLVNKIQFSGGSQVDDLEASTNFILGYTPNEKYSGEAYNKPLVVQYDIVTYSEHGLETNRRTEYQELDIKSNNGIFDGVGDEVGKLTFGRNVDLVLGPNEAVDESKVIVHNIYGIKLDAGEKTPTIDLTKRYYAVPKKAYARHIDLSELVTYEEGDNAYFFGYSRFSLNMKKNMSIKSTKYPTEHLYYLDLKSDIYQQNLSGIKSGKTRVRYSLYNLYSAKYHFIYKGSGGKIKDVTVPISLPSDISYQVLESDGNNVVACVIKDSDVASDFTASNVIKFEIQDLVINMDLFTSSASGSTSIIGKSALSFTFAYVTVFDYTATNKTKSAFNFNIFLIIFVAGFVVAFALLAVGLYFFKKNRYKNDEFRRVNKKKYIKSAIIGGLGATVFALAITFIIMRFAGFSNTIVTFNPVDPFVIIFGVAGLIVFGYFIVVMVKSIKVAKERRKHIRLRLDEDVVDDGTN